MQLVLYQPEIPQNTGTLMRLCSCFSISLHIIEPCGYILNDRRLRRSGMDYLDTADVIRHDSWSHFKKDIKTRYILLTPYTTQSYLNFEFQPGDALILGRESCGVPNALVDDMDACVRIPMAHLKRSLNVAVAGAIVLSEALRQIGYFNQLF